ncbi:hypothetical protein ACJJTC_018701 [Scirpophaga incertulas]
MNPSSEEKIIQINPQQGILGSESAVEPNTNPDTHRVQNSVSTPQYQQLFYLCVKLALLICILFVILQNDPEGMRMFFGICVMKLILQILYFGYNPDNDNIVTIGTYWYVKVMDCVLALIFLIIVRKYMNQLLLKKTQKIQASKPKRQPNTSCFGIVVVKKVNKPQPIPVEKKVENV